MSPPPLPDAFCPNFTLNDTMITQDCSKVLKTIYSKSPAASQRSPAPLLGSPALPAASPASGWPPAGGPAVSPHPQPHGGNLPMPQTARLLHEGWWGTLGDAVRGRQVLGWGSAPYLRVGVRRPSPPGVVLAAAGQSIWLTSFRRGACVCVCVLGGGGSRRYAIP